jgi:hypothetical protein
MPWVRWGEFDEHLRNFGTHVTDDQSVHARAETTMGTILAEVRSGNTLTEQMKTIVEQLQPYGAEIIEGAANRRWRKTLYRYLVAAAKGGGWIAAFVGGIAAVAAAFPSFHDWLVTAIHSL